MQKLIKRTGIMKRVKYRSFVADGDGYRVGTGVGVIEDSYFFESLLAKDIFVDPKKLRLM